MKLHNQQNLQGDDRMSASFGSYCHQSGQPRKISIGVMVESSPSRMSAATKENQIPLVETKNAVSPNIITSGGNNNKKSTRKPDEETSPWITKKYSRPWVPSTEKTSTLPTTCEGKSKLNGPKVSVHSLVAKMPAFLQSGDGNRKEFDTITYKRKQGATGRMEEDEAPTVGKPVIEDEIENNGRTDNLRRQLFDILGTVSSPKSEYSQNHGASVNSLNPKPVDKKGDAFIKPRLSSDTIEPDSESPQQTIRRPVTRSLIRKKTSIEARANKTKIDVPLSYQKKDNGNSTASFKKGRSGGLQDSVDRLLSTPIKKKGKQAKNVSKPLKQANSEIIHPGKVQQAKNLSKTRPFSEKEPSKNNVDTIRKATHRTVTSLPAEKTSSLGKNVTDIHALTSEDDREDADLNSNKRTGNFHQYSPPRNATPIISTSPSPISKTYQMMKNISTPVPQRKFTIGDTLTRMLSSPKSKYFRCDFGSKAHDEEDELNSSMKRTGTDMEEENSEDSHSKSSEEHESRSSEEGSPEVEINSGSRKRAKSSEEARNTEEETLMFSCPLKKLRSLEGFNQNEFGESDWIEESPDDTQDTGLVRAVALFSLALEKLKRKMTSLTTKKCSEILVAATEGVYLQLQDVESQIQADVGKLTNLNKAKRKQLEGRFQEQHEQLKLMTLKFQEEVRRHLQASKNIIKDMRAQQKELKETVEMQKVSHQKLFLEVEEAVETELDNAQTRIAAVQEVAMKRMFQLKQVMAECLKDGSLS